MTNNESQAILFFVKYPTPGKVKTRLAKTIGDQEAARLYQQLAETNFIVLRNSKETDMIVAFDPPEDHGKVHRWLSNADHYIPQEGLGLGERLAHAFQWAFDQEYKRVVAYGSDTLSLTTTIVEESFVALNEAAVVIGPAKDGGYYLIGMNRFRPELFQEILWSTDKVLQQTYNHIKELNLSCQTLIPLEDLDEIKIGEHL